MKKLTSLLKNRHAAILSLIFMCGMALFAIVIVANDRIPRSDDTVFQTQTAPYGNVVDWIMYRYESWSGRLFSEGFVYVFSNADLLWWKITTILMYGLFVGMLFAYYRLLDTRPNPGKDKIMLTAIICLVFLFDKSVLAEGLVWVTGSMVYFWTSALGLLALYPLVYFVVRQVKPPLIVSILGLVSAVIAASSQEQVGLILIYLSTLLACYYIYSSRKLSWKNIPWYPLLFVVTIGAAFAVSLLAPGNTVRTEAEIIHWLPDLPTTSLLDRIHYGYRWLLEVLIKHSGFLLIGSWVLTILLIMKKKAHDALDKTLLMMLVLALIFSLAGGFAATSYWLDFYATWKPELPSPLLSLTLLPWGIILLATVASPLIVFRRQPNGYMLSLLYIGVGISTAALLTTPTMYASLWRSFFVPSVLLAVVFLILLNLVISSRPERDTRYTYLLLGGIIALALSHFIFQFMRLVSIT